jgi:membrane protease YdiL (CAAX protease family)
MPKLMAWLQREEPFSNFFRKLPKVVFLIFVSSVAGAFVASFFFPPEMTTSEAQAINETLQEFGLKTFLIILAIVPIAEEFLFRFGLIGLPILLYRLATKRQLNPWCTLVLVIASSAYFGYIHGNPANIFIQGIGGAGFAIIFIKWSVYGRRIFVGLFASTITHEAFNAMLGTLILAASLLSRA